MRRIVLSWRRWPMRPRGHGKRAGMTPGEVEEM